ncbi:hypothetical protein HPB50_018381 [Hyalomma asiaticum]|uniref:Uncharacterized protein n=1 Tax=Hyalomma asiaticum TaxID=266040 RepID=A0ACB7TJT1_HYAAI|nr:hypothetical protein HPB50_018381 [Hyalomma asiaticum]
MPFDKEWMLECILLKMRSPNLYEYIRKQKILVLPSRTTIRKYLSSYMGSFGFHESMLQTLRKKTSVMDTFKCQGGLIVDEMSLSVHLSVDTSGKITGFVDLGLYTPKDQACLLSNHGLVVMFVPLVGNWTQILGAFATHTNIKGDIVANIILDATVLAERAGLFVNYM